MRMVCNKRARSQIWSPAHGKWKANFDITQPVLGVIKCKEARPHLILTSERDSPIKRYRNPLAGDNIEYNRKFLFHIRMPVVIEPHHPGAYLLSYDVRPTRRDLRLRNPPPLQCGQPCFSSPRFWPSPVTSVLLTRNGCMRNVGFNLEMDFLESGCWIWKAVDLCTLAARAPCDNMALAGDSYPAPDPTPPSARQSCISPANYCSAPGGAGATTTLGYIPVQLHQID